MVLLCSDNSSWPFSGRRSTELTSDFMFTFGSSNSGLLVRVRVSFVYLRELRGFYYTLNGLFSSAGVLLNVCQQRRDETSLNEMKLRLRESLSQLKFTYQIFELFFLMITEFSVCGFLSQVYRQQHGVKVT